ncbi:MAG: sensor histidine kinase [Nitrospirota bacterium]
MTISVRKSLKAKLFLIFFVLDLSVILLVGFISYQSKKDALKHQAENSLSIIASELADKVDRYLSDKLEDSRAIALHYSLYGLKTTTSSQNAILSKYLKIYPYFDHISVINVEDIKKPDKSGYSNSWYLPALSGQITSSDMYISPITDRPTMSFAAPVYDKEGKIVSILTTNLKLEYLWEIIDAVQRENIASGHTGYAFLVNRDGLLIGHPNRGKILMNNRSSMLPDTKKMVQEMTSGKTGTAYYTSRTTGVRKLAGFAPLKGFGDYRGHGWSVGVNENYSELLEPMNRLLKLYFLLFIITSFVALAISRYLAEYIVRPVNKLREGASRIGSGNFDMRIPRNHEDEIGELANSFNSMADALQERDLRINEYTETLREANHELERTNDELVRLEKEKADFNAMITHDIKSPLSTILTYAEMIREGSLSGREDIGNAMSSVYASGKKILTLVDNYLVSSAIDAGKLKLNLQPLDINDLVEDSMTFFVPQAERRNVSISFVKGAGLPHAMADKVQLDRVICNILGNALKYIPSGASVAVSTRAAEDGIEIDISDTGNGIPEKDVETMFQKFRRSSATGKIDGMGLGLYISKAIAEAHGGGISLRSRLGEGTTFTIRIPAINKLNGDSSL